MTEERKGFFTLVGRPGSRKTTEALWTFQDALYIASSVGLDQFYTHTLLKTPEAVAAGKKPIKQVYVLDQYTAGGSRIQIDGKGEMMKVPQRATLEKIITQLLVQLDADRTAGRPPTIRNVIIDEATVFWSRFFIEIVADMQVRGNNNGPAHHQALQMWTRQVIDRFRTVLTYGVNLIAISHAKDANGHITASFPNAGVGEIFTADAGIAMISTFEDAASADPMAPPSSGPPRHMWRAYATAQSTSKVRGISAERLEEIKFWHLEQIVKEAGFSP